MHRTIGRACAVLLCALAVSPAARAQSSVITTATTDAAHDAVTGVVLDVAGEPLADVVVRVEGSARGAVTDARGRFRIAGLPAGAHVLRLQRIGLTAERREVDVGAAPATLRVTMHERAQVVAPVVVSASREMQRRTDVAATIDVLGGADVRLARAAHPSGVMQRIPGVKVAQLSGEGHSTAIRQPLTTKALYLFLEDGIPTRSTGFFNHNALYEVNVPQSGGLEVLKGPGTALYGSDAIGGVVNVLTRPAPVAPSLEASLEGGDDRYLRLLLSGGASRGRGGVRADLNVTRGDGWRDASGFQRQSGTVRWDHAAGATTLRTVVAASRIDQSELAAIGQAQFDGRPETNLSPSAFRKVRAVRWSTAVEHDRGATLLGITPYARYNVLDILPSWQLSYDPQLWSTSNRSAGVVARARRDVASLRLRLTGGADLEVSPGRALVDRITPTRAGPDSAWASHATNERLYDYDVTYRQASPWAQVELGPWSRVKLEAGARYDASGYDYASHLAPLATGRWRRPADTSLSYRRLSPKLGVVVDVARWLNLHASWREGFRAPGQSQLFQQGSSRRTVALAPVTTASAEVGARGQLGARVLWSLAAYDMRIDDDVLAVVQPDGARTVANAGRSRHRGLEAGLGAALASRVRLDLAASASRQRYDEWTAIVGGRNVSFAGKAVEAAPRTLANLLVTWSPPLLGGGRVAAEWTHTGGYWMDPDNTREYAGHALVSLHGNLVLRAGTELFGRVVNVGDVRHAEVATYNAFNREQYTPGPGRQLYLGVRQGWSR